MCGSRLYHDSSLQERIVIEKADQEEVAAAATATAAACPAASAVEYEQHEATEMSTSIGMPATIATRKCVLDTDVHNATVVTPMANHLPERSANLSLVKQETNPLDALSIPSPAIPISKQVDKFSVN